MPSKGSPRRTMRFPQATVDRIEQAIDSANQRRAEVPYDWTGWVLQAVAEKLRSLERGRASSRRRRPRSRKMRSSPDGLFVEVMNVAHETIAVH